MQLAPDAGIDAYIVTVWTVARTKAPLRLITSIADFHQACARISGEQQQQQQQRQADTKTQRTKRQWQRIS